MLIYGFADAAHRDEWASDAQRETLQTLQRRLFRRDVIVASVTRIDPDAMPVASPADAQPDSDPDCRRPDSRVAGDRVRLRPESSLRPSRRRTPARYGTRRTRSDSAASALPPVRSAGNRRPVISATRESATMSAGAMRCSASSSGRLARSYSTSAINTRSNATERRPVRRTPRCRRRSAARSRASPCARRRRCRTP